jgi:hypothetical protein
MSIAKVFFVLIQRTPPPIDQTLAKLSNRRMSVSRRPPQYHIIVQNNGTLDSRAIRSNISTLHSANNVAMTRNE